MICPNDGSELRISDRHGVEIDYCPKCRGVWLDRGELDRILDRAAATTGRGEPDNFYQERRPDRYDDERRSDRYDGKKRRRRSLLDDLFDFD